MSKKLIGIFIEPRKLIQIKHNIKNFFDILPNTPLYFFCGKGLKPYYEKKYKEMYKDLHIIPLNTNNLNYSTYSNVMKSMWFWKIFGDAEYALTIQTDGCLCKNSKYTVEDFLKYDYVGGYHHEKIWWKETNGLHNITDYQCFNGGFSLRNIKKSINVIRAFPPKKSVRYYPKLPFTAYGEDLYFVCGMLRLKYKVGLDEFATTFCTHSKYVHNTFCVHKLNDYENEQEKMDEFYKYCEDFKLYLEPIEE